MAAKVFISYRRDDGVYQADRIYKAFCEVVPRDDVFMDSGSIDPGADFPNIIKDWVNQCDVLLALITRAWIDDLKTHSPRPRSDWVRIEIGAALARKIPVVPVLMDGTPMPDKRLLDDLKELADRQAEFVQFRVFDDDVKRLIGKVLEIARKNTSERSLREYSRQAENAAKELGELFGFEMMPPLIELAQPDSHDINWDGTKIIIPPGLEHIPDLIVNEVAIPFVTKVWDVVWKDQSGALAGSYRDVLTSIVKQARLHQTAEQADWTVAPGALAPLFGEAIREGGTDQRPLRSLKAPGTAYSGDPQIAHFRDLVATAKDDRGRHINSGIPNKAFYEAAMKIGTEKAGRIWLEALKQFRSDMNFSQASREIIATTSRLYGAKSPEAVAVRTAWKAVGL